MKIFETYIGNKKVKIKTTNNLIPVKRVMRLFGLIKKNNHTLLIANINLVNINYFVYTVTDDADARTFQLVILGVPADQKTMCNYACVYKIVGMQQFEENIANFKAQLLTSAKPFSTILRETIIQHCNAATKILEIK